MRYIIGHIDHHNNFYSLWSELPVGFYLITPVIWDMYRNAVVEVQEKSVWVYIRVFNSEKMIGSKHSTMYEVNHRIEMNKYKDQYMDFKRIISNLNASEDIYSKELILYAR